MQMWANSPKSAARGSDLLQLRNSLTPFFMSNKNIAAYITGTNMNGKRKREHRKASTAVIDKNARARIENPLNESKELRHNPQMPQHITAM